VIIAYNHAHLAMCALRASNWSSTHDCTLEAMRAHGVSSAPQKPD
jgi:hypothetical protein